MSKQSTSFLSPKLKAHPINGGRGVFAHEFITAGETLAIWGGTVMERKQFDSLSPDARRISVQVEEDLFLVPSHEGAAEWFNHSCTPNAGMQGQIGLVALRGILPGEEVCYDYAMSDGSPYDEFECHCGSTECRGRITGNDWQLPSLWERYNGFFSPYLNRRIMHLKKEYAHTALDALDDRQPQAHLIHSFQEKASRKVI